MADPAAGGTRVLAVAESDAYLKWAAWLLDGAPGSWSCRLVVLDSPTAPSAGQCGAAVAGTRFAGVDPHRTSIWSLRSLIGRHQPDVLLLACTGPTIASLGAVAVPRSRGMVVASGLPGIGLPVRERAITARACVDVFVAHSRSERAEYVRMFTGLGLPVTVALARLPFLRAAAGPAGSGSSSTGRDGAAPVLFAPQPSVPPSRPEREALLLRLAAIDTGTPPVVKLRATGTEAMTHDEPHPYPRLWDDLVDRGAVAGDELRFATGPLHEHMAAAACLVTVSSTAALEAMAAGVPVVLIDDFGVSTELLNDVFEGSGRLAPLTTASVAAAGLPDQAWMADNYFHDDAECDWPSVFADPDSHRHDRRWDRRAWKAVARRTARLALARGHRS